MLSALKSKFDNFLNKQPYISFVAVARNDDHGGNFLKRMQIFVSVLCEQLVKHDLTSELIVVDWNPPKDKPKLAEVIESWISSDLTKNSPLKIRVIELPPEIHKRFKHSDKFSVFEFIGKNVGIRRAKGKFVISTNSDLLFSEELVEFLATKSLESNCFYRIDRTDVKNNVPYPDSISHQLDYCSKNITTIHGKYGSFKPDSKENVNQNVKDESYPQLHTNASGDFIILPKKKWHELHGYPELEMYQHHFDSVMCHMAYQSGLKEKILEEPMRIYHMEHSGGWNPEKANEIYQRLRDSGVSFFDFSKFQSLATQMQKEHRPKIFNDENWGLGNEVLPETSIN